MAAKPVGGGNSDEPTAKAVSDRFAMWEKRVGDSLTPLRQATPLQSRAANQRQPPHSTGKGVYTIDW